jgi:hypothetical protein
VIRSPWGCLDEARELLDALGAGRLAMGAFRERFGAGLLDFVLDGDAERAVAFAVSLETAVERRIPPAPADPAHAALTPPRRCEHVGEPGVLIEWDIRPSPSVPVAGCEECLAGLREHFGDEPGRDRPADHLDRCATCDELTELAATVRVTLGDRLIDAAVCATCAAFAPEGWIE